MLAKKIGFGFGIAVILPLMVHYGVSTFVRQPKWENYHNGHYYEQYEEASPEKKIDLREKREQRELEYRSKRSKFERHLFFVAVPVGLAAVVIGSFLSVQAIGAGLIFGGIFTLIDGYCWYWSELQDWMRFVSLLVAFVVLVVMGYSKLNNK